MKSNFKNKRFGDLIAIRSLGKPYWLFKCYCGKEIIKNPQHIKNRKIENLHCGCKKDYKLKTINRIKRNIKIDKNDCWVWQGGKDRYGKIQYKNKCCRVHRVNYELYYGKFDKKMYVCHTCDNSLCCNPDHLWLGTQDDNMKDMAKKKRGTLGRKATKNVKEKMSNSQKARWSNIKSKRVWKHI